MNVIVYVEGPSDRLGLEALLRPIIEVGAQNRVGIRFVPLFSKAAVIRDAGRKAADQIADHPEDWVFALPDLYPMHPFDGTENEHHSFAALAQILKRQFERRATRLAIPREQHRRFRVHCLKHDLEALLLASPEQLRRRLGTTDALRDRWRRPVEEQNDHNPPKRIVDALFAQYRRKPGYQDTVDAPWILARASLESVLRACPEQFAPFVTELRELTEGRELQ